MRLYQVPVMNTLEIEGTATLCFHENGLKFQGVIQAKDDAQYAVYGTKSANKSRRRSQAHFSASGTENDTVCGCESESAGPGFPVAYDIRIVDCEIGDEYSLKRVHGRNGKHISLRCKSVSFDAAQIFKGERADMELQKIFGHGMEDTRGVVYKGPVKMAVKEIQQASKPWVL